MWPKIIIVFFLVVFGYNAFFTYSAIQSQRGLVSNSAYEDGLKFDQRKQKLEKSKQLNWQVSLLAEPGKIVLKLSDAIDLSKVKASLTLLNLSNKSKPIQASFVLDETGRLIFPYRELGQLEIDIKVEVGNKSGLFFERIFLK